MNLHQFRVFILFIPFFILTANGPAFGQAVAVPLPDFDKRIDRLKAGGTVSDDQRSAVERLRVRLPSVRVDFDLVTGAPKMISAGDKFLSGTNGQGKAISAVVAAGFAGDPHRATRAFLQEHSRLFGYGPEVLNRARVKREFVTPGNGMKTMVWEQQVSEIPVFEAVLISHTTARGELVNLSSQFIPSPESAADQGASNRVALMAAPDVSARKAVTIAAQNIGETIDESGIVPVPEPASSTAISDPEKRQEFKATVLKGNAEAKLVWLPMSPHRMRLCWDVILMSRARGEMFRVLVDVQSGEPLLRHCLTDYLSEATYRVYTSDSPSPFSPSYSTPTTSQPPLVSRTLLTLSALDTNASPAGWINDGGNETVGNNVDAHTDRNADNLPDLPRPQGAPFRVFDFPLDLTQAPGTYTNAAVVQLFYWNNFMHDKLYELGFTEAAGNFQSNNFGRGGLGNDAVQADAQDGSGVNNANFSTPPDGSPGRMQMYLFTSPSPARDGDLDAEVMLHEYTHGLSNRRVGGGVGISALQTGGMGEGWSDFYAMALLSEPGDDVNAVYAYGGYVTYQLSGLTQNYYFGIRRYPYCTDMGKNPLTFKDIDPAQASAHTGVPRSPIIGNTANEVHNMGEVWCMTLREARANLINKYGWAVGNQLVLQLVTDGMNLSPANPNFLQARDAILQADQVDKGGADLGELWTAFAKRGMGFSATSPASSTASGVQEAFDVPDNLHVNPSTGLSSSGQVGGPFNPACQTYWLSNLGTNALAWTAWTTQPWVSVSVSSGNLTPGSSNSVDVCLTAVANALGTNTYTASVIFSNTVSGMSQIRGISLYVSPPRVLFFPLDTDPGWSRQGQWTFGKPAGLGGSAHGHPDPTTGATGTNVFGVNLSGDYSISIGGPYYLTAGPFDFSGYNGIKLQFQRWLNTDYPPYVYATIEISTNGTTWTSIWSNSSGVEIADATWTRLAYDISAYADGRTNVYVRWGHNVVSGGAFAYSGWNLDDIEFLGNPTRNLSLSIPATATEGAGVLVGTVTSIPAPTNDLVVTLNSSDTTEATVPVNVTIPAGQSNAVFNLTIVDDGVLDGPQNANITAAAPGYGNGNATITVFDNETAVLSVLLPATATEGQGTAPGTVQVSAAPAANITVSLSSSDATEIQVPASVILPAGQTSAVFTATVVDDNQIDGPQTATVTAHVQNWTDGTAGITVLDNENTNLTVVLPAQISEGAGVLTNAGRVSLSGTVTSNVVVSLVSGDPARLIVPATVTISAGQVDGFFNLTPVDNTATDGSHSVTVTAAANGFKSGAGPVVILDDDADHFAFSVISNPQNVFVPFAVTITALDLTNGVVVGFQRSLTLSAAGAHGAVAFSPTNTGAFTAGQWTGSVTMSAMDTNVVLAASDGNGHVGASNPFNVMHPLSTFIPAANRVDMVQDSARGLLYITAGNQVLRYDLNSGTFLSPFVFGSSLCGIDISPDYNTLVVADTAAFNDTNVWVYVVDLPTGTNRQATFPRAFYEGGTYAVAFGYDGAVLISSTFLGSGWTPLRRYDPASGNVTTVANPSSPSMVSGSGDGRNIAVAEGNISSGPLDRYDVASQTITGSTGDGWFNFEVGVNRNGSQFAVPTYGGTFIYDTNLNQIAVLGTYASEGPIGLAYHPQADLVFFAWWPSSYLRAYETYTMAEVARYDCGYNFGWTGNGAFGQGRVRVSQDGNNLFVTVSGGVRWISRPVGPPADLALTQTNSPNPVDAGNNLTYTITVTNKGPNGVTDARVFDRLPAGAAFVSATSSQGTCTLSNGLVTCALGVISNAGAATISIVVVPSAGGVLTNTAAVVSSAADPNPANNAAIQLTTVHVGILGITPASGFASSGPAGGPFTPAGQTYVLTNSGNASLVWSANKNAGWITLTAGGGALIPGAIASVTVSINGTAASLARGVYSDTVSFTNVTSGFGSANYVVTLTVNTAPVALPQTVTVPEDGAGVITLQGTDVDGDALTAIITNLPAHGTLYQTADGINPTTAITTVPTVVSNPSRKVVFVLGQHGYGNDYGDFQFKVNDGLADSAGAPVTVNVTHVNHPPAAANDTVAFLKGTAQVTFNVLINDADVDGDPLTVQSFTSPARGTLTQTNNGQFRYQPNAAFTNGQDQFNYTIADGHGGAATGQVTMKVYGQLLNGGDWPTFGNGPSHTGYYPAMLGGATLLAGWSTNFGAALNQVAVGSGNVYVTPVTYFGGTYLAALNAASGQSTWQYNFSSAFSINPPTFDQGRVYVQRGDAGSDTQLWSIDAASGSVIWSAPHAAQWERYYAPTVVGDGIWVDGGYYGGMYGFGTNGAQRFFFGGLQQYDQWTPTYYQGTIYSWVAGEFRAHDPLTGAVLWMASFGWNWDGWSMNTVSAIDGGRAFVQQRPNLIAIDLTTHTNVWTATGGVKGSPAVANGIVYAIIGDGVQAFSAQDGTSLGIYEATNDTGIAWQPIVTDDALFVASPSGTYIFNLASHQLIQTIPYGGTLSLAGGWLYIAGQDGWLRAYTITNNFSPVIVTQPVGQVVTLGGTAGFNVVANGTLPMSYQWKFNGTNLVGATNISLTLTNVQMNQAGNYTVAVTNLYGSALSSSAVLTVVTGSVDLITFDDLTDTTSGLPVPAGYHGLTWSNFYEMNGIAYPTPGGYSNGVVSVSNVVFNWFGNPASIVSTNPFTLVSAYLTAAWTPNLQVRVRGYAGGVLAYDQSYTLKMTAPTLINFNYAGVNEVDFSTISSDWFAMDNVSILAASSGIPPVILLQPTNQTVFAGGTASLSVTANGTVPLSYQWRFGGTNIAGATNTTLTLTNVQFNQAGNYAVLVTNLYGTALSSNAVLTVNVPPPCANPPAGLIGWWQAEGNASDSVGGNNGAAYNLAYSGGEVGQAFVFDGASSYIQVPASSSLNVGAGAGLTIEGWIKPSDVTSLHPLVEWNDGLPGTHFWISVAGYGGSGALFANLVAPGYVNHIINSPGGLVSTNTYQHVAVTYNKASGMAVLYLNGAVVAQTNLGSFTPLTTANLYLGYRSQGVTPALYQGLMDEMSIYNRDLSSNDIAAVYNAGSSGKCAAVPPTIYTQPTNQAVAVGGMANFTVAATGITPLSYQWRFGGTNIAGATNATLTLTNVQLNQAGSYAALVTNLYGSALSSNAALTVNSTPPCANPPAGLVGWWPAEGNAREIIGGITGTVYSGTAYLPGMVGQAFSFDGTNGCVMNTNSTPYTNIQNTFTMEFWAYPQRGFNIMPEGGGLGNSGQSYAIFPDWGGSSSSGPAGAGVCVGTNGISVVEHCNNYMPSSLSYTNLINGWTHIAVVYSNKQPTLYVNGIKVRTGVTSPETFVYPSKNFGGSYSTAAGFQFKTYGPYKGLLDEVTIYNRALASNEVASIYNAGISGKCVPVPPAIYTQPTNQAVVAGGVVNFSVAAAGTAPLSYQWRFGGTNLAGATNTTLTLTNVQMSQAGNYSVAVTNFYGAVLSSNALLTVAVGMDHFTLSPIPSPRFVNTPFAVSIQARNPANGVFTNFTGTAILDSTNGVAITPPVSGSFIQGVWTGSVVIAQTASNLVLRAGDGLGHFGFANSVNVIGLPRLGMVRSGNIVMFLWPVGYSGFVLEASGRLSPAAWVAVPYSPIQIGDQYMLPLDLTGTNGFYRLRLPGN